MWYLRQYGYYGRVLLGTVELGASACRLSHCHLECWSRRHQISVRSISTGRPPREFPFLWSVNLCLSPCTSPNSSGKQFGLSCATCPSFLSLLSLSRKQVNAQIHQPATTKHFQHAGHPQYSTLPTQNPPQPVTPCSLTIGFPSRIHS